MPLIRNLRTKGILKYDYLKIKDRITVADYLQIEQIYLALPVI